MNLAFCSWLLLRKPLAPWVMFHEVAFPREPGQPWRHQVLGKVTHVMAGMMAKAAERIFVSVPRWEEHSGQPRRDSSPDHLAADSQHHAHVRHVRVGLS